MLQGLLKACEKRPVPVAKLEAIVDEAEAFVSEAPERERTTKDIGEHIMGKLKKLDKVAYVRFASVYLDFKDVKEFMDELKGLLKDRATEVTRVARRAVRRRSRRRRRIFLWCGSRGVRRGGRRKN